MREEYTRECCGQEYEAPAAASPCCAPDENSLHVRRDAYTSLTICGLPAAEVKWEFQREFIAFERSDSFDPNHYCHACIGENNARTGSPAGRKGKS